MVTVKSTCAGDDEAVERSWKHTAVASTQASSQTGMGHFMTQDATQDRGKARAGSGVEPQRGWVIS